jgi:hypothetical protein
VSEARHITVDAAELTVTGTFDMHGSILAGTAEHTLHGIRTELRVESPARRDQVAAMVEQAERMCFVLDAIQRPHEVERMAFHNGTRLG